MHDQGKPAGGNGLAGGRFERNPPVAGRIGKLCNSKAKRIAGSQSLRVRERRVQARRTVAHACDPLEPSHSREWIIDLKAVARADGRTERRGIGRFEPRQHAKLAAKYLPQSRELIVDLRACVLRRRRGWRRRGRRTAPRSLPGAERATLEERIIFGMQSIANLSGAEIPC